MTIYNYRYYKNQYQIEIQINILFLNFSSRYLLEKYFKYLLKVFEYYSNTYLYLVFG